MRTKGWMVIGICAPLVMMLFSGAVIASRSDGSNGSIPVQPHATKNIMVTGFWNPTGQMILPYSTDPYLNPGGWKGGNWEGKGYDVYSFFPKPGQYNGTFEVDYQNTWADFWNITAKVRPIAIVSFGAGNGPWEIEYNARNLNGWVADGKAPTQPTPNPPDNTKPVNFVRHSTLPVQNIADAINSQTSINAWVDWNGDPGAYLCEFMAYLGMWYQDIHNSTSDPNYAAMAGFIHVVNTLTVQNAMNAVNITLREVIKTLGSAGMPSSDTLPLQQQWYKTVPIKVSFSASAANGLTNVTLWSRASADNKTWGAWKSFAKANASGNSAKGDFDFTAPDGPGYYEFYTIANDSKNNTEPAPTNADGRARYDNAPPTSTLSALPQHSSSSFTVTSDPSDALSGVHDVALFYRKDSGTWTSYGTTTKSPWSWQFTTSKDGLYEFYSMANDMAGNTETAPVGNDTWTRIDTLAPTVVGTDPKDSATDVPLDAKAVVSFSETMDDKATEAALSVDFTYDLGWDTGKTMLTLTPKSLLENGKKYTVQIGAGAMDIAGNHISAMKFSFTTVKAPVQHAWLIGKVKDSVGTSVAGASIKVTGTGLSAIVYSGTDGSYNVTINATGNYQLIVSKSGFDSVTLNVNVDLMQKEFANDATLKKTGTTPQQPSTSDPSLIYGIIGAIIAIVVIAIITAVLLMRKRKRRASAYQYPPQYYQQDWQQPPY